MLARQEACHLALRSKPSNVSVRQAPPATALQKTNQALTDEAVYVLGQLGEGQAQLSSALQERAPTAQLPDIEAAHRVGAANGKQIIVGQVPHAGARPAGSSSRLTDSLSRQALGELT